MKDLFKLTINCYYFNFKKLEITHYCRQLIWSILVYFVVFLSAPTYAAVSFVGSSTSGTGSPAIPAGTVQGNLMLLVVVNSTNSIPATPTGWTLLLSAKHTSNSSSIFYKVASATNTSPTIISSGNVDAGIMSFAGEDTTTPFDSGYNFTDSVADLTTETSSVSATSKGAMEVITIHSNDETQSVSANGFTTGLAWMGGQNQSIYGIYKSVLVAGTLPATTVTRTGNSSTSLGGHLIIRPAITPLADWHMDESAWTGAANEVIDSSGNGRNATSISGANTNYPGKICADGKFNGSNYVNVGALNLGLTSNISVMAWVKWGVTPSSVNSWANIISNNSTTTSDDGQFWLQHNSTNANYEFAVKTNSGRSFTQSTTATAMGTWQHVTGTYDGTNIKIYVNGALQNSVSLSGSISTFNSAYTLNIGRWAHSASTRAFTGDIDEVMVFGDALTATQISTIYGNYTAGNDWNGTARTCPTYGGLHHIEIQHASGTGLSCASNTLIIKACQDATCSTAYTGGVTGTLTSSGTSAVNWDGTSGGATGAGFVIPSGSSTISKNVQVTPAGNVVFNTTSLLPSAGSSTTCNFGSPSCTFTTNAAGFLISNSTTGNTYAIPAQVSGITFGGLYLRALQASTTNAAICTPAIINQTTTVNMSYACNNPSTCQSGSLATVNSTAISNASTPVSLSFDVNASAPITLHYDDVGQITLNASKTITPTSGTSVTLSGSSNPFVVAPDHFVISGVTAAPIKAGNNFSATVTSYNGLSTPSATKNFGKEISPEGVSLSFSKCQPTGIGASNGSFSGTSGAFNNGAANSNNLSWTEVGNGDLTATLTSGSYLNSGLTVRGNTGNSGLACNGAGNVGRFIPDHFDTLVTQGCATGSFTYSSQPFMMQVIARNLNNNVTVNYDGSINTTPNSSKVLTLSDSNSVAGGSLTPSSLANTSFLAGIANASPSFTFTSSLTSPATIKLHVIDTDSVVSSATEGTATIRSGRLRIQNSYGSELLNLPILLETQYWNGLAYIRNQQDSCTTVPASSISMNNYFNNLSACESQIGFSSGTGTFMNGISKYLRLSKPGVGNNGSVNLSVNLNSASGKTCITTTESNATSANINWLGTNPVSRYTFGIYKTQVIYIRENF
jgi:MSHA biogenesis protein MshQ